MSVMPAATKSGGQVMAFPDVCKMPGGPPPPVPYPNKYDPSGAKKTIQKVQLTKKDAMTLGNVVDARAANGSMGAKIAQGKAISNVFAGMGTKVLSATQAVLFGQSKLPGMGIRPSSTKIVVPTPSEADPQGQTSPSEKSGHGKIGGPSKMGGPTHMGGPSKLGGPAPVSGPSKIGGPTSSPQQSAQSPGSYKTQPGSGKEPQGETAMGIGSNPVTSLFDKIADGISDFFNPMSSKIVDYEGSKSGGGGGYDDSQDEGEEEVQM